MPRGPRTRAPIRNQTDILLETRRRCCVCFGLHQDFGLKRGQIAHIDGNRDNHRQSNLVFLCLEHHEDRDLRPSQTKKLSAREIVIFRRELIDHLKLVRKSASTAQTAIETATNAVEKSSGTEMTVQMDETASSGGQWRLRFSGELSHRINGMMFSGGGQDLYLMGGGGITLYRNTDNALIDHASLLGGEKQDVRRQANYLASHGLTTVYGRISGGLAVYSFEEADGIHSVGEPELIAAHASEPSYGGFGDDGAIFISADTSGDILIWDWPERRVDQRLHSVIGPVVGISADKRVDRLVATGADGRFEVFDMTTRRSLGGGQAPVRGDRSHVQFSYNAKHLIARDEADRCSVFDADTFEPTPRQEWHSIIVESLADAGLCLMLTASGIAAATPVDGNRVVGTSAEIFPPVDRQVSSMAISPDGKQVVMILERRTLRVWDRL